MTAPLLAVEGLEISAVPGVAIVDGLDLTLERGETLGLVGESGCGKSLTALAIMRLLAGGPRITGGRIALDGTDLIGLPEAAMRHLRGDRMAMIYQEPLAALNPVMTVGAQVVEVLRCHRDMGRAAARARAAELLAMVRIPDAARRIDDYPHRLSGGMRQRVVIAMALACNPALLIADEPTTALDVTVQAQILRLARQLQRQANLGLLLITHDLGVVRQVADRVVVMYAGAAVEEGPVAAVLDRPRHPYTAGLIAARPHGSFASGGHRLEEIAGAVPAPGQRPAGCVFAPRCPRVADDCRALRPALLRDGDGRAVRCHHPLPAAVPP